MFEVLSAVQNFACGMGYLCAGDGSSFCTLANEVVVQMISCTDNGRILLANLLQGSRSTFSQGSFPSFFAFEEGMWDIHISALLSSPTVSARFHYDLTVPRCRVEFSRRVSI